MIHIQLTDTGGPYALGEAVSGEVYWQPGKATKYKSVEVKLSWHTEGRGDKDGATVVVGTHQDRSALPRRLGMAVETVTFSAITASAVLRWAERRIHAARIEPCGPGQSALLLTREAAEIVAARAGTSWRTVADELHVWAASLLTGAQYLAEPVRVHSQPVPVWNRSVRARGRNRRRVVGRA